MPTRGRRKKANEPINKIDADKVQNKVQIKMAKINKKKYMLL